MPEASITRRRISSRHVTFAASSESSVESSSAVSSTAASSIAASSVASSCSSSASGSGVAGRSSDSTSSPKWTPWNRFNASASICPDPLISMNTSRRSPLPTRGTIQLMCVPPTPSSVFISQSVRFSPPLLRMCQSVISKFAGMTSLMYTSCRAVSPLFSKRIKTSYRPFPPTGSVCFPAEKSRRL